MKDENTRVYIKGSFCVKESVGSGISTMNMEIQCKENLHDLNEENYPRKIMNEIPLSDDEEYHREDIETNVALKFKEFHCDKLSRQKQKQKQNLREEGKICVKNINISRYCLD